MLPLHGHLDCSCFLLILKDAAVTQPLPAVSRTTSCRETSSPDCVHRLSWARPQAQDQCRRRRKQSPLCQAGQQEQMMWRQRAGREGGSGGCTGVFQAERRKGHGPGRRNGTCKGIEARGEKLRPVGPGTCGCRAHAGAAAFQAGSHCDLGVWQCSPGARVRSDSSKEGHGHTEPLQNEPHVPGHSWQRVISHLSSCLGCLQGTLHKCPRGPI